MSESKNKFKVIIDNTDLYDSAICTQSYVFVKKIDNTNFVALHSPASCKDYVHETIASLIHQKRIANPLFNYTNFEFNSSKLQIVLFLSVKNDLVKNNIFFIKKYLSAIEKKNGIKQTLISEIDIETKLDYKSRNIHAFLLTFDKVYIESLVLFHIFYDFFRTLYNVSSELTKDNIVEISKDHKGYDSKIVNFILKHDIFNLLLKNHKEIIQNLSLEDIYPEEITNKVDKPKHRISYHGGFGIIALTTDTLASKPYSDNIRKIYEQHVKEEFKEY